MSIVGQHDSAIAPLGNGKAQRVQLIASAVLSGVISFLIAVWTANAESVENKKQLDAELQRGLAVIEERENNHYLELSKQIRELREDLRERGRIR